MLHGRTCFTCTGVQFYCAMLVFVCFKRSSCVCGTFSSLFAEMPLCFSCLFPCLYKPLLYALQIPTSSMVGQTIVHSSASILPNEMFDG
jgi:hypothetical protein